MSIASSCSCGKRRVFAAFAVPRRCVGSRASHVPGQTQAATSADHVTALATNLTPSRSPLFLVANTDFIANTPPNALVVDDTSATPSLVKAFASREQRYLADTAALPTGYSFPASWHANTSASSATRGVCSSQPTTNEVHACIAALNILISQATTPQLLAACCQLRTTLVDGVPEFNRHNAGLLPFTYDTTALSLLNANVLRLLLQEPYADVSRIWDAHTTLERLLTGHEPHPRAWAILFTHPIGCTPQRQAASRAMFFESSSARDPIVIKEILRALRSASQGQHVLDFLTALREASSSDDHLEQLQLTPEVKCEYALALAKRKRYIEALKIILPCLEVADKDSDYYIRTALHICRQGAVNPSVLLSAVSTEQLDTPQAQSLLLDYRITIQNSTADEAQAMVTEFFNSHEFVDRGSLYSILHLFCQRCYDDKIPWLLKKMAEYGVRAPASKCFSWIIEMYLKLRRPDIAEEYLAKVGRLDLGLLTGIITGYDRIVNGEKVIQYSWLALSIARKDMSIPGTMDSIAFASWKLLKYNRSDLVVQFDKLLTKMGVITTDVATTPILLAYANISFDAFRKRWKEALDKGYNPSSKMISYILRRLPPSNFDQKMPEKILLDLFQTFGVDLYDPANAKMYMDLTLKKSPSLYVNALRKMQDDDIGVAPEGFKILSKFMNTTKGFIGGRKSANFINFVRRSIDGLYPKDDMVIAMIALARDFKDVEEMWIDYFGDEKRGVPKQAAFNALAVSMGLFHNVEAVEFLRKEIRKFGVKPTMQACYTMLSKFTTAGNASPEALKALLGLLQEWNYLSEIAIQRKLVTVFFKYGQYALCVQQFVKYATALQKQMKEKHAIMLPLPNFELTDKFYDFAFSSIPNSLNPDSIVPNPVYKRYRRKSIEISKAINVNIEEQKDEQNNWRDSILWDEDEKPEESTSAEDTIEWEKYELRPIDFNLMMGSDPESFFTVEEASTESEEKTNDDDKETESQLEMSKQDELRIIRMNFTYGAICHALSSLVRLSKHAGYNSYGKGSEFDRYIVPILEYAKAMGINLPEHNLRALSKYFPHFERYLHEPPVNVKQVLSEDRIDFLVSTLQNAPKKNPWESLLQ